MQIGGAARVRGGGYTGGGRGAPPATYNRPWEESDQYDRGGRGSRGSSSRATTPAPSMAAGRAGGLGEKAGTMVGKDRWFGSVPGSGVGGGGSAPPAYTQSDAFASDLANPEPIDVTTPMDPSQQAATTGWETYGKELQAGTAAETQRELQRYRDEISTGMESEGEAAIARGADPSLFRSRSLESGKRGILELQGRLADVSLGRRAEALGGFTNAAQAGASERRQLHLGTMSARLGEQRLSLERADLQARLREMPYNRLMELMRITGQYGGGFGGLTNSGSGGWGAYNSAGGGRGLGIG